MEGQHGRQSGHGSAATAEEQSCPGRRHASPGTPSSVESTRQSGHGSIAAAKEHSCPGRAHASPGRPCNVESGRQSGHSSAATAEEQSCPGSGDQPRLPPLLLPDEIVEVMEKDKATLETRLDEVARGLEKLKEENVRKRAMIETFRGSIDRIDKAIAELKEQLRETEDTTKQEAAAAGPSGANSYSGVPSTSNSIATSSSSPTTVPAPMVISQRNACPAEATAATPAEEEESDRPLHIMDLLEVAPSK